MAVSLNSFSVTEMTVGNDNIIGTFRSLSPGLPGADHMLEIGFKTSAGTLNPGQNTEIQTRFSKENWTSYTQTDDYSFADSLTSYADWSKVTGYVADQLQWGMEP